MNASKPGNAPTSATTSHNAPAKPSPSKTGRAGEAEYLETQARNARAAMGATLQDMKLELVRGLSPLELARRHPWLALLGSAVGGFAAAATLVPSREQQALDRLRRMHEAMHPQKAVAPENGSKPETKRSTVGALLAGQLIGLIRPIVASLLSAALAARPNPSGQSAQTAPEPSAAGDAGANPPR